MQSLPTSMPSMCWEERRGCLEVHKEKGAAAVPPSSGPTGMCLWGGQLAAGQLLKHACQGPPSLQKTPWYLSSTALPTSDLSPLPSMTPQAPGWEYGDQLLPEPGGFSTGDREGWAWDSEALAPSVRDAEPQGLESGGQSYTPTMRQQPPPTRCQQLLCTRPHISRIRLGCSP